MARERIDRMMVRLGLAGTRSLAQALVMEGRVSVEGRRVDKAGFLVAEDARIELAGPARPFVSRGGLKLQAALESFPLEVGGATALDVGAGTGGFTDCLLKTGAEAVFAVDVGRGQIDHGLRIDPRVTVIEGLNARFLTPGDLPGPVDLAVMDVSFISATMILPNLPAVLRGRDVVVLVKPQFEVGRELVGKGGIVRDPASWRSALLGVIDGAGTCGFGAAGIVPSPVRGAAGNQEFLLHLVLRRPDGGPASPSVHALVNAAVTAAGRPKP
ncbi:MAG TPA: TlyA family RNA methyltransferase [Candidatus Saccharimonadales bacterium]|nr:TlyA family RNA methyltransferase [Candidatus Saccharimonadales bacterium]